MSAQSLIHLLEKMLRLQQSLFDIADQKTEVIKKGEIEALNILMKDEQTHVAAIDMIEKLRVQAAVNFTHSEEKLSIADCIERAAGEEKLTLQRLQASLLKQLAELKAVNSLNQELLAQSLQFVHLNLDLLLPGEDSSVYTKTMEDEPVIPARSLFDSKA